jgi:hypothetical protein
MLRVSQTRVPVSGLHIRGNDGLHMGQKIFLRSRGSGVGSHHLSRHHITTENEGTCAVSRVLKLAPLHFSRSQRQSWMLALQSLHPGQLIRADRPFAFFDEFGSLPIDLTDRPCGCFSLRINWRSQPGADQMRSGELGDPFF